MEWLFRADWNPDTTERPICFLPNWGLLPNYSQIDEIILILNNIKNEYSEKEIEEHNTECYKDLWGPKPRTKKEPTKEPLKVPGVIYLIRCGEHYKIGRTKDINKRYKKYITENPNPLELIFRKKVDDMFQIERELLEKFSNKKVQGEWFKLEPSDISFIAESIE